MLILLCVYIAKNVGKIKSHFFIKKYISKTSLGIENKVRLVGASEVPAVERSFSKFLSHEDP